jgi:hypothetical protein
MERDEIRDLRWVHKDAELGIYVFETERGRPMWIDALQYIVREAGRLAELPMDAPPLHAAPRRRLLPD